MVVAGIMIKFQLPLRSIIFILTISGSQSQINVSNTGGECIFNILVAVNSICFFVVVVHQ